MKNKFNELMAKVKEITASGLPFMNGKDKIDLADGDVYLVTEFGFLEGEDDNGNKKDFVVLTDGKTFAYGGSVVTDSFNKLSEQLTEDELEEVLKEGLPIKITKRKAKKSGKKYTSCEFYPQ